MAKNPVPIAPKPPKKPKGTTGSIPKNATTPPRSSGGSSSGGGGKKSGGGKTGTGGAAAYERRAVARENAAKKKAGKRYLDQASNLEAQAKALRFALKKSYKGALKQNLGDVNRVLKQQQGLVREGYRARRGALAGADRDNEMAAAGQSGANMTNLARERSSALSETAALGAGESDTLRSMSMSLRNWTANQSDVQRSYSDTLRSINSSRVDLNIDTKTAFANNQLQAQGDKEQLWTNYYDRRSESLTQLGNIRGQQADYFAMAKEMGVGGLGKPKKAGGGKKGQFSHTPVRNQAQATKASEKAFMAAARASGQSWKNPGLSKGVKNWDGRGPFKETNNFSNSALLNSTDLGGTKRPEGATLRKW